MHQQRSPSLMRDVTMRARTRELLHPRRNRPAHQAALDNGLVMGRHSYDPPRVIRFAGDSARVIVGAFTSIGPGVEVFAGGNHNTHTVSTFPFRLRWNMP